MTYKDQLEQLAQNVGNRNGMLVQLAHRGLAAGLSPEELIEDIIANGGDPPLTQEEVSRAVNRAVERHTGSKCNSKTYFAAAQRAKQAAEEASDEERAYVPRMIAAGWKNVDDKGRPNLINLSPVKIRTPTDRYDPSFRVAEALAYIKTVFPDDRNFVFTTDNVRSPRDLNCLSKPSDLYRRIEAVDAFRGWDIPIPTHCCPNQYTGDGKKINGKMSYANKDVVATRRLALIEFDALPMNDQMALWTGVVSDPNPWFDVRAIVHTGNKSLHALVRVPEIDDTGDLFGNKESHSKKDMERHWDTAWNQLLRAFCSCEDPAYRCDRACKDASRMTRFPGGLRDDSKAFAPHSLFYCAAPNLVEDVFKVDGINWQGGIA